MRHASLPERFWLTHLFWPVVFFIIVAVAIEMTHLDLLDKRAVLVPGAAQVMAGAEVPAGTKRVMLPVTSFNSSGQHDAENYADSYDKRIAALRVSHDVARAGRGAS